MNYCLKELKKKGLVKIKNFKNNKDKIKYIHVLTPKGSSKSEAHIQFYEKKMKEYEELKAGDRKKKIKCG